jgi:hypothetical protein
MRHSRYLLPLVVAASPTLAQPFSSSDARAMAMGDTGVASASDGAAALFNPALLAQDRDNTIDIILPNIGAGVFADSDALDAIESIEDDDLLTQLETFTDSINSVESFQAGKDGFVSSAQLLRDNLADLDDKPFRIDAGAFAAVSVPTETLGISVYVNATATIEAAPLIDTCDFDLLDTYITFVDEIDTAADLLTSATTNEPANSVSCTNEQGEALTFDLLDITEVGGTPVDAELADPSDDLSSRLAVAGVTIAEAGISIAHNFELMGRDIAIGITPKYQEVTHYSVVPTVQDLDDDNYDIEDELEASETSENAFNLDIGFSTSLVGDETLVVGLVIKNLISNSYDLANSDIGVPASFDIEPQVRAGLAWDAPLGWSFAADLDLTDNSALFFGDDTRFLGLGAEWDIFNSLRFRAGMRTNLSNTDDQLLSAGLGFNIIAVHFDLAVQASDNNLGGALQAGLAF